MKTDEDLRQQMIAAAGAFRFDQSRLEPTTIARGAGRRRRRRRVLGAAVIVAAMAATATVALTRLEKSSDSVVLASGDVYLVPTGTPQGLVLRRSSVFTPRPSASYFNAFYRDGDSRRIAVISVLRDGLEASTTSPRALATSSGFWMSWHPRSGVEINVATVGLSRTETEALLDRLGVDPARGTSAYGLLTMPPGFRSVGDERDTTITGATLNVYATPDAKIADPQSRQPRVDVTVGRASDTYREINRVIFDERTTAAIRGHEAEVVIHRANADHGTIVTVSWFEQPALLVDVTAYNMTTEDAVTFARSLEPVTFDEWTAHRASARG